MQSAWTISSRSSLEKGARARGERGMAGSGGMEKKERGKREGREEKGGGEGRGEGRKTSAHLQRAPPFFPPLFLSSARGRRETERVFFRFSVVHTSRDNASRAFTCVEPRREPLASPSRERNGRRAVLSSSPIIFHLENFQNYPAILFFFP